MTTDRVKNAKMTTESVVNFVFFETLTSEKSATGVESKTSFAYFITLYGEGEWHLEESIHSRETQMPRIHCHSPQKY